MSDYGVRWSTLPRAYGAPPARAVLRASPDDFVVEELLGFEPAGQGEHVLLQIRKRGATSATVAVRLARFAGVSEGEVGYCGLKDKHAVSTQWFSVRWPSPREPDWGALDDDGVAVLRHTRHARKLRRGTHRANRFEITLTRLAGERAALEERLSAVRARGFPNYFGPQRFGADGANAQRARALLRGEHRARRAQRGLLLSALRAWLFNEVLAARVADGSWCRADAGDVLMLDGTHSVFVCDGEDLQIPARLEANDLHVAGPLCGPAKGPNALTERERAILDARRADLDALERNGPAGQRRALRALAGALRWQWQAPDTLWLGFELAPGVFATSLVRELIETWTE